MEWRKKPLLFVWKTGENLLSTHFTWRVTSQKKIYTFWATTQIHGKSHQGKKCKVCPLTLGCPPLLSGKGFGFARAFCGCGHPFVWKKRLERRFFLIIWSGKPFFFFNARFLWVSSALPLCWSLLLVASFHLDFGVSTLLSGRRVCLFFARSFVDFVCSSSCWSWFF